MTNDLNRPIPNFERDPTARLAWFKECLAHEMALAAGCKTNGYLEGEAGWLAKAKETQAKIDALSAAAAPELVAA